MGYQQRTGGTHAWRLLRARALRELPLVCAECRSPLDPNARRCTPTAPELDHIVPAAAGGADTLENVRWMCHPCNRRKSDRRGSYTGRSRGAPVLDRHGMEILNPTVRCRVHNPILASCPHSGVLA